MTSADRTIHDPGTGRGKTRPVVMGRRGVVACGHYLAAATIAWFREHGYDMIPGDGLTPAGVCAVPDALVSSLDRFGTQDFATVAEGAIGFARDGYPMSEAQRQAIAACAPRFRGEWPGSASVLLPGGKVPKFWTSHYPSLFYPHTAHPGNLTLERRGDRIDDLAGQLKAKGHVIAFSDPWTGDNTMVCATDEAHGILRAAANPRFTTSYALAF